MKISRLLGVMCATGISLLSAMANAVVLPLEGRLETAPGSGMFLAYYDPNQDITWAANANINGADTWNNQVSWAAGLNLGGVSGWRLPTTLNPDATCEQPAISAGNNCTGSEMGYLYYEEGITFATPGPFSNVQSSSYWSGTERVSAPGNAWIFRFDGGFQTIASMSGNSLFAWAVRDGDVSAVPLPAAVWLFGSGLLGLIGVARKKAA